MTQPFSSSPHLLAAIDLEGIVPALIVAFYVIAQIISVVRKGANKAEQQEPARKAEDQDRLRRIQEEIRRKIEERQRQLREGSAEDASPAYESAAPSAPPPRYDPHLPESMQRTPREPPPVPPPAPVPTRRSEPTRREEPAPAAVSYEEQLRAQRRALQAAREARDAAFAGTSGRLRKAVYGEAPGANIPGGSLAAQVRQAFATPESARAAFVMAEVFARPVSMREADGLGPG